MAKKTIGLIMNPAAGQGRGKAGAGEAANALRKQGLFVREIQGKDAAESQQLATDMVTEGIDALVVAGGDGTIHLGLQVAVAGGVPLGIMPLGTGDDNARGLGIPIKDLDAAARVIVDGYRRTVDCGQVTLESGETRYYLGVLSVGFDSEVNERANNLSFPKGESKYLAAILAELAVFKPVPFDLEIDGELHDQEAMLMAFGNGISYGGGMKVCPDAKFDDGLLDLTVLGPVSKLRFISAFPNVFKGTHSKFPFVHQYKFKRARVDAPGQTVYADGERIGPVPAMIDIVPQAVDILVPTH